MLLFCIFLSGNVWDTFKETAQKLGNVYRMHVLGTVYIVISDPAIAKQVVARPAADPSRSLSLRRSPPSLGHASTNNRSLGLSSETSRVIN